MSFDKTLRWGSGVFESKASAWLAGYPGGKDQIACMSVEHLNDSLNIKHLFFAASFLGTLYSTRMSTTI